MPGSPCPMLPPPEKREGEAAWKLVNSLSWERVVIRVWQAGRLDSQPTIAHVPSSCRGIRLCRAFDP